VLLSAWGGKGFHVDNFEELHFIHELVQGEGPSLSNGLQVFSLFNINVNRFKGFEFVLLSFSDIFFDEAVGNMGLAVVDENTVGNHFVEDCLDTFFEGLLSSSDVKIRVLGGFIWGRDSSEVGNGSLSGLLVKSLDISGLTHFK
jgi:hypothetical protein